MPIEAELKAHVHKPEHIRSLLRLRATEQQCVYRDTYYDTRYRDLAKDGRELRVRVIETDTGNRCLLTYKAPAVDARSGSKPEHEISTDPGGAAILDAILRGLRLTPSIAFTKHCTNYPFTVDGRWMLATLVTVPEIDGTFLEVETLANHDDLRPALDAVRSVLADLGVRDSDLTTDLYTDAVRRHRSEGKG